MIESLRDNIQFLIHHNWLKTCAGFISKTWFWGLPPDRACVFSTPYKINWCCAFKGHFQKWFLTYQLICISFDVIYKGNTQEILNKRMDCHFSDVQKLIKNRSKNIFVCGPLLKPFQSYHITPWPTYTYDFQSS